jgi:hypothetical protein
MTRTFKEIGLKIDVENVSTEALDRVIERKYMHPFSILDIETLVHVDEISQFDPEVITCNLVHLDSTFLDVIGAQTNEHSVPSLLSTEYTVKAGNMATDARRRTER